MLIKITAGLAAAALAGAALYAGSNGHLDPVLSAFTEIRAQVTAGAEAEEPESREERPSGELSLEIELGGETDTRAGSQ